MCVCVCVCVCVHVHVCVYVLVRLNDQREYGNKYEKGKVKSARDVCQCQY